MREVSLCFCVLYLSQRGSYEASLYLSEAVLICWRRRLQKDKAAAFMSWKLLLICMLTELCRADFVLWM